MSSSDEEQRQQQREREVLGDEIERMRELLGRDFPASDDGSSAEEEGEEDSEEEAIDDCTGYSSYPLGGQTLHDTTKKVCPDLERSATNSVHQNAIVEENGDITQEPQVEVTSKTQDQHAAGSPTQQAWGTGAHHFCESVAHPEAYTLTELRPANHMHQELTGVYTRLLQFASPQNQDTLSTQAEQSLIQHFQTAELPVESSFISENDEWEENDVQKMLRLNREYQAMIMDELKKVELALIKNREQRTSMGEARSRQSRIKKEPSKSDTRAESQTLRRFAAPYLKDDAGHGPPDNEDARLMRQNSQISAYQMPSRIWTPEEQELLAEGIRLQNYEQKLSPLMQRLRELKDKQYVTKLEKAEAEQLERDIAVVRAMPKKEFEMELEGIDWDKLSTTLLPKRSAFECQLQWCHFGHPRVNQKSWTKREDKQLMQLAQTFNNREWNQVAERLQTNRTPFQCLQRYQKSLNRNFLKSKWTPEEDERLKEVVRVWGEGDWQRVAGFMEGRTGDQCSHRYQKTLRSDIKKGKWSEEEDQCLLKAVEKYGARNWYKLADLVAGRTGVQCRERYVNVLDPTIKRGKGSWTQDEDQRFLGLIEKYGEGNWSKIARELGDRTDNQCWRRWMVLRQMDFIHYKVNTLRKKRKLVANFSGRGSDRPTITEKDLDIPDLPVQKPRIGRPPRARNPFAEKARSAAPSMALTSVSDTDSNSAQTENSEDRTIDPGEGSSLDGSDDEEYRPSNSRSLSSPSQGKEVRQPGGRRAAAVRASQRLAAVISAAEPGDVTMDTDVDHVLGNEGVATETGKQRESVCPDKAKSKPLNRRKQGGRRERVQSHHRNLMNKWQLEKRKAIVQMQRKNPSSAAAAAGGGVAVSGNLAPFSLLLQAFSVNVPAIMQSLQKVQAKEASKPVPVGQQSSASLDMPQQPLLERRESAVSASQLTVAETTTSASSADQQSVDTVPTLSASQQSLVQTQTSELDPPTCQRSSIESAQPALSTGQQFTAGITEPGVLSSPLACEQSSASLAEQPSKGNRERAFGKDALQQRVDSKKNDQVVRTLKTGQSGKSAAVQAPRAPYVPRLPPCHSTLLGLYTLWALKPQLQKLAGSRSDPGNERGTGSLSTQESRSDCQNNDSGAGPRPAEQTTSGKTQGDSCRHSQPYKLLAERFHSLFLWPSLLSKVPLTGPVPRNFLKKVRSAPPARGKGARRGPQRQRLANATPKHTAAPRGATTAAHESESAEKPPGAATAAEDATDKRVVVTPGSAVLHHSIRREDNLPSGTPVISSNQLNSHRTESPKPCGEFTRHDSPGARETRTAPGQSRRESGDSSARSCAEETDIRTCGTPSTWPSSRPDVRNREEKVDSLQSSGGEHCENACVSSNSCKGSDVSDGNAAESATPLNEEQMLEHARALGSYPVGPPDCPPTHPDCPPTHPDCPPTHLDSPPTHPDCPPTHPDCPPTHPDSPPTHLDSPPTPEVVDSGDLLISMNHEGIVRTAAGISAVNNEAVCTGDQTPVCGEDVGTNGQTQMGSSVEQGVKLICDTSIVVQAKESSGQPLTSGADLSNSSSEEASSRELGSGPPSSREVPAPCAATTGRSTRPGGQQFERDEVAPAIPLQVNSENIVGVPDSAQDSAVTVPSAGQLPICEVSCDSTGTQGPRKRRAAWPHPAENGRPNRELKDNGVSGLEAAGHVTAQAVVTPRRKRKYLPTVPARRGTGHPM